MVTASFISRLSRAVNLIEKRLEQSRPLKVVKVRRGFHEDRDAARDRHFAAHPDDRDANIVIFDFCDDEEVADKSKVDGPHSQPPTGEPIGEVSHPIFVLTFGSMAGRCR